MEAMPPAGPFLHDEKGAKESAGEGFRFPSPAPLLQNDQSGGPAGPPIGCTPREGTCATWPVRRGRYEVRPRRRKAGRRAAWGRFQRGGTAVLPLWSFQGVGCRGGGNRNPPPRPFLSPAFFGKKAGPPEARASKLRKKDAVKTHSVLSCYTDYSPTTAAQRGHSSA